MKNAPIHHVEAFEQPLFVHAAPEGTDGILIAGSVDALHICPHGLRTAQLIALVVEREAQRRARHLI